MIEAPVFHVNGDDPEAVVFATKLALDYRMQFSHDVVLDIVCFRKLGHNEQDTPSLTQPLMYKSIGHHPGTRKLYADKLTTQGVLAEGEGDQLVKDYRQLMKTASAPSRRCLPTTRASTPSTGRPSWGPSGQTGERKSTRLES